MAEQLSRKKLYDLVWSEPMRSLSVRFGISDVALKKTCARAGIPTPDRGYWAKKEAGKETFQAVLPMRPPGMDDEVSIASGGNGSYQYCTPPPSAYVPGSIAKILSADVLPKLSSEDKEALNRILPEFLKAEAMSSIAIKAVEIDSLKRLAAEFKTELNNQHPESWWQNYIQARILLMQQGYIRPIEKMNVAIGNTKYPHFALVTHDNYLDIFEIKKPNTTILKEDRSRSHCHARPRALGGIENLTASCGF